MDLSQGDLRSQDILTALTEAAEDVFNTMLTGMAELVGRLEADSGHKESHDRVDIEAIVRFSGDYEGTVVLLCSTEGALDITRGLLMMDEQEPIELEEIQDAIGECANMLGGSLKTNSLDKMGQIHLGTPVVASRVNRGSQDHMGSLIYNLTGGPVVVSVWLESAPA